MEGSDLEERSLAEVAELHGFFESWFTGRLVPSAEEVGRLSDVLDDAFEMVAPSGERIGRDELIRRVRRHHGSRRDEQPFRVWTKNARSRPLGKELCLVTYEEWQQAGGETGGRLSTAVFARAEGTPNGVAWLHLHETWLP